MLLGNNAAGRFLRRVFGPARITPADVLAAVAEAQARTPLTAPLSLETAAVLFLLARFPAARWTPTCRLVRETLP